MSNLAVQLFGNEVGGVSKRYSKNNRLIGDRVTFSNTNATASQLRTALKESGLKGRALSAKVREAVLTGKDMAWAKAEVAMSALRSNGYIPDYVDVNAKGASVRLVKPVVREEADVTTPADAVALLKSLPLEERKKLIMSLLA